MLQKVEASRKKDKEEMEANRKTDKEEILKKMDEYQAKTDAVLLAMQMMETSHKEIVAVIETGRDIKTMAC
jgi:predicted ATP-grasp superfamily ATP-dependent carboligase